MRNLRMFKKLVGQDNLGSIVLATTFWNQVDKPTGDLREHQLSTTDDFWGGMIGKGSRVFRHNDDARSGREIIEYLLKRNEKASYNIQREMVLEHKKLDETAAGAEVQEQVEKLRIKYEKELAELRTEIRQAKIDHDKEMQDELKKLQAQHEAWLENHRQEQEKAAAHTQELWETRQQEREAAQEKQYQELLELQRLHSKQAATAMAQQMDEEMKLKLQVQKQQMEILWLKQQKQQRSCCVM